MGPPDLFAYFASVCPARERAWDCGCGNGQSSVQLAEYFGRVDATDISEQQLASAAAHPRVHYRKLAAESPDFEAGSMNLVHASQAVHWFDLEAFHAGVHRVLAPGGIVALWAYNLMAVSEPVDRIVLRYYRDILGEFWPVERRVIEAEYKNIPFPFEEIETPEFHMEAEWSLDQLIGYMKTWSARNLYLDGKGKDPADLVAEDLRKAWGETGEVKRIRWPLFMRVGRKRA